MADIAPAELRGTAYGFFNLVSGLALLVASTLAGILWDKWGAEFTFYAGGVFAFWHLSPYSSSLKRRSARHRLERLKTTA